MQMKLKPVIAFLPALLLAGCTTWHFTSRPAVAETAPVTVVPDLPRWILWERALGDILNGPAGNTRPDLGHEHGLCEWEIWGQSGKDVYVWALCKVYHQGIGTTATSAPAVVRLARDDSINAVIMPAEGWGNLRDLFPADVLTKILNRDFDLAAAEQDIALRIADPGLPPLIIQQGLALP